MPEDAHKPLSGKRIIITRPLEQAQPFVDLLEKYEARPVVFSTIKIVPPQSWDEVDAALRNIASYDALIFTSVNGVRYFFERLIQQGMEPGMLGSRCICAIGPSTADRLARVGLQPDIVPEKYQAESVVDALDRVGVAGKRFLLPRAEQARELLPKEIQKRGGTIDVVSVYRTEQATALEERLRMLLLEEPVDVITFTSSSTVHYFMTLVTDTEARKCIDECVIACIGPITAETAREHHLIPHIIAEEYTIEGLTKAMIDYFSAAEV